MEEHHDAETPVETVNGDFNGAQHTLNEIAANDTQISAQDQTEKGEQNGESASHAIFQIKVKLPHKPYEMPIMVSTQEQVQDFRLSIVEQPDTYQYSCFHLEHNGHRINDCIELSEVKGLLPGAEVRLVEDPYTEKEARQHLLRVRDLIGAVGDRVDTLHGMCAGISLHDTIVPHTMSSIPIQNGKVPKSTAGEQAHALVDYDFDAPASIRTLLPPTEDQPPKTIKSINISSWNPPPYYFRQQGHLMYILLTTNEGEQFQITSHVSGFFVNKSSNSRFDPYPKPQPKSASAHSLLNLIAKLSPSFETSFASLQQYNARKDPLANIQITSTIPANPWLVPAAASSPTAHQPDIARTQESYLFSGLENAETLRDWNEEFQSTRELPKESVQDRVFRERLTIKLFAEYNEAAARGAVMVARGEVAPLNPTENRDAQIFVYNNVFFSYGADGVGMFTSEGGDEAARVAVGKDVTGIRAVNQLDIDGLFTPGTIVVDYLGKRIVGQSIVPGIFKQREPGENQIDYGGVEGRDVVAANEAFVPVFSKFSKVLRVKKHDVWDKEGKKHTLEASVETKGLLGTDGRKYILDLYRLTPLDISWLEEHWIDGTNIKDKPSERNYPHRMTVLRAELVEAYWRVKMGEYVKEEVARRRAAANTSSKDNSSDAAIPKVIENDESAEKNEKSTNSTQDETKDSEIKERVDISAFDLAFNPDVFCGQAPPSEEQKANLAKDEEDVRSICRFLHQDVIPELIRDLRDGDVGFPMDGQSLGRLMHKRGINMRYLGNLASLAKEQSSRLEALNALTVQEMIARSFKHVVNRYIKNLPAVFVAPCISHFLNCLLGADLNKAPRVYLDEELQALYPDTDWAFAEVDIDSCRLQVESQVHLRFRYSLDREWASNLKHIQLLREICLKLGLQLSAKDYQFRALSEHTNGTTDSITNEQTNGNTNGHTNGVAHGVNGTHGKKKKRNGEHEPMARPCESLLLVPPMAFCPDDIVNIIPVVKDACPRSVLAEEALEAGKISIMQNQKELGQELLLESLSLHEQIYNVIHPEVARVYHQLSMLYYQLDEKNAAVELARKAVFVFERTVGLDSTETILSYLNLGLFEHANGNTKLALVYMKHALELWKIIYGIRHPDSITTINNAAVMLQNLKHYHESRMWFETSLAISEEVSGKTSVNTATLCFQLAQALALDQEAKAAVNRMREAYSIFLSRLGPDDRNTKESESWLEQLTQNAVSIAKHAKDVQARRLRRIHLSPQMAIGTRPQRQVGQSSADIALGRDPRPSLDIDPRSVDELLKFIEGGGDSTKRSSASARTSRNNPKRRGGTAVA